MIAPAGKQTAPINFNLSLGGSNKTAIEMDDGKKLKVRVTSDNKIQLTFQAKQYVGEIFRYTNDLYLIYKSGTWHDLPVRVAERQDMGPWPICHVSGWRIIPPRC
jgi:hypothetical protein